MIHAIAATTRNKARKALMVRSKALVHAPRLTTSLILKKIQFCRLTRPRHHLRTTWRPFCRAHWPPSGGTSPRAGGALLGCCYWSATQWVDTRARNGATRDDNTQHLSMHTLIQASLLRPFAGLQANGSETMVLKRIHIYRCIHVQKDINMSHTYALVLLVLHPINTYGAYAPIHPCGLVQSHAHPPINASTHP